MIITAIILIPITIISLMYFVILLRKTDKERKKGYISFLSTSLALIVADYFILSKWIENDIEFLPIIFVIHSILILNIYFIIIFLTNLILSLYSKKG